MKIIRDCLLEGTQSTESIVAEPHKLIVYSTYSISIPPHPTSPPETMSLSGQGIVLQASLDTPRGQKMSGSLVVVFSTSNGPSKSWSIFDSGRELATVHEPPIGYIAFFSDAGHEFATVISGLQMTLTYDLYFDDEKGVVSSSKRIPLSHRR